jgi:hypothetical protein
MKMSKMILGKTAENGNLTITPNCRKSFVHLGQNVEKYIKYIKLNT